MIDNIVLHCYIMSGSVIYLFQSLSKLIEDLFLSKLDEIRRVIWRREYNSGRLKRQEEKRIQQNKKREEAGGEENTIEEERRGRRRREYNRGREKRQEEKRIQQTKREEAGGEEETIEEERRDTIMAHLQQHFHHRWTLDFHPHNQTLLQYLLQCFPTHLNSETVDRIII